MLATASDPPRILPQPRPAAVETAQLFQLAESEAVFEERQRLARELHDSVSQTLLAIAVTASAAERISAIDRSQWPTIAGDIHALSLSALEELQAIVVECHPETLQGHGVVAALADHAAAVRSRCELDIQLETGSEPAVPLKVKEVLYRVGQEAIHNAVKHAGPASPWMALNQQGGELVLVVADNGCGFDCSHCSQGILQREFRHSEAGGGER